MNREIKVRLYNPRFRWVVTDGITIKDLYKEWYHNPDIENLMADKETIWMQYTGLKDKNQKEICEGDIVTLNSPPFVINWDYADLDHVEAYIDVAEVIGNIYENPELLK